MGGSVAAFCPFQVLMPKDFLIPLARDARGALVPREEASHGTRYRCLGCDGALLVREGSKRRHFAHLVTTPSCLPETVLHRAAKALLVTTVEAWKAGQGPCPEFERRCTGCGTVRRQPLPDRVTGAREEHAVSSGRILDVGLMAGDDLAAGLEVLVTHTVDSAKAADLAIPWVELSAEAVIANPLVWRPLQDLLRPMPCAVCEARRQRVAEREAERLREIAEVAREVGLRLPWAAPYTTVIARCNRQTCGRRIPIFSWPGHHEWTTKTPPSPRPPTVQFIWSKRLGSEYWANVCIYCGRNQGDYYLFLVGGPLGVQELGPDDDLDGAAPPSWPALAPTS